MPLKKSLYILLICLALTGVASAQKKRPRKAIKPAAPVVKKTAPPTDADGKVVGRTYTNTKFGFEVTFPDEWLIPDSDFEAFMKSQGFDLGLKAPDTLPSTSKAQVNAALARVSILLTAYRSLPGSPDNAIVRISTEDLAASPQIKDAVDYFDAMRATFAKLTLPPDLKISETQAEKLGDMQFAYLDANSDAGKKRMYATVRDGHAIMFTISYTKAEDVETLRDVLSRGKFKGPF